jgi:hypothetical protein
VLPPSDTTTHFLYNKKTVAFTIVKKNLFTKTTLTFTEFKDKELMYVPDVVSGLLWWWCKKGFSFLIFEDASVNEVLSVSHIIQDQMCISGYPVSAVVVGLVRDFVLRIFSSESQCVDFLRQMDSIEVVDAIEKIILLNGV